MWWWWFGNFPVVKPLQVVNFALLFPGLWQYIKCPINKSPENGKNHHLTTQIDNKWIMMIIKSGKEMQWKCHIQQQKILILGQKSVNLIKSWQGQF